MRVGKTDAPYFYVNVLDIKDKRQQNRIIKELEKIISRENSEQEMSWECMMFKDDALVDGSRMMVYDEYKIRLLERYAKKHGYIFSCTKKEDI